MTNKFLEDLRWRGLVHQCTDLEALGGQLDAGPVTLYCGFDPTADSLHVGSLIPLITLKRFLTAGHRAVALIGGATGLIGDPSGKTAERVLQTSQDVAAQAALIRKQIQPFVDGDVQDNLNWTQDLSLLGFLRDVGKHFSVNAMIRRDSISSRLEREGDGISFTEFSYMLLQAFDFLKLAELEGCTLQIGGSDQWGNMCSGADLIRRELGKTAFALTMPLLTSSDGQKFGKTVNGAIWLDAAKTSPWEFYQFWAGTPDADVIRWMKLFSERSRDQIDSLASDLARYPELRVVQRLLAEEMTALIHGPAVAAQMKQAAGVLFARQAGIAELSLETLTTLTQSIPTHRVKRDDTVKLNALLVATGLETSMTKANKVIQQSPAVTINTRLQMEPGYVMEDSDWLHGRFLLLQKGKKHFALVERID